MHVIFQRPDFFGHLGMRNTENIRIHHALESQIELFHLDNKLKEDLNEIKWLNRFQFCVSVLLLTAAYLIFYGPPAWVIKLIS